LWLLFDVTTLWHIDARRVGAVHSIIRDWAGQAAGPAIFAMPR
jgi:hypothetical protein